MRGFRPNCWASAARNEIVVEAGFHDREGMPRQSRHPLHLLGWRSPGVLGGDADRQPGNAIMLSLGHRRRPFDASLRPMRDTPRFAEKVKAAARNRRWNTRMALKPLGGLPALF
jgi:hypothetical protein